jgi:hypothetical protein
VWKAPQALADPSCEKIVSSGCKVFGGANSRCRLARQIARS